MWRLGWHDYTSYTCASRNTLVCLKAKSQQQHTGKETPHSLLHAPPQGSVLLSSLLFFFSIACSLARSLSLLLLTSDNQRSWILDSGSQANFYLIDSLVGVCLHSFPPDTGKKKAYATNRQITPVIRRGSSI